MTSSSVSSICAMTSLFIMIDETKRIIEIFLNIYNFLIWIISDKLMALYVDDCFSLSALYLFRFSFLDLDWIIFL